jgi:aminoglycoside phosphotransferase (APT) family kinase protein
MPEQLPAFIRRRPTVQALAWAVHAVGGGARVTAIRRLRGGSSSSVHALTVERAAGARQQLVLRCYVRAEWLAEEPDIAERESRVLRALAATPLPAPEVVACDTDGSRAGVPAVLMRRLPGRIDLSVRRLDRGLESMADLLAGIHSLAGDRIPGLQPYRAWHDPYRIEPPRWSRNVRAWVRLIEVDQMPMPATPGVLLHRDFHPGNVLWRRDRLVGIADWVNACRGPAGIDVAHCRVNLAMLLGVAAAERFREAYERVAGRRHAAEFDARALLDMDVESPPLAQFHDAGRPDLTADLLNARCDELAERIARRL